jgi:hypothetical protein
MEMPVASRQCTLSDFFLTGEFLTKNIITVVPHPTNSLCLGPPRLSSVSLIEDKTERPPFLHN